MSGTEEPSHGLTGLVLAEHYFGSLLSPIDATPAQWTPYAEHRQRTNAHCKNAFVHRTEFISDTVAGIEGDLSLDAGTLQKCVSVMRHQVRHKIQGLPGHIGTRIFSPSSPKCIDVHIKYHCVPGIYDLDWNYSLGYKIHHHMSESDSPTVFRRPSTEDTPPTWHSRRGWQTICWGYFADDKGKDYDKYDFYEHFPERRIEEGQVELHNEGVLDIHRVLFGQLDVPPSDDAGAVLRYRRKLSAAVRLLLAAVGIEYRVACTDGEADGGPGDFILEGLSDRWVAQGIRAACGFQLSDDPAAAKRGEEERREEAGDNEDDDGFSDDY